MGALVRTEGAISAAEATEHNLVVQAESIASGLEVLAGRIREGVPAGDRPDYLAAARAIVTEVVEGVATLGLGELIARATAAEEARAVLEAPEAALRATESLDLGLSGLSAVQGRDVPEKPDPPSVDDPLIVLSAALVGISVCVPGDWEQDRVVKETNAVRPTGIRSIWSFVPEDGDEVVACDATPGRVHWFLSC